MTEPGAHILVIEDDPDIQTLLQELLTAEGYRVSVASRGREGLRCLTEEQPVLLILDLGLPDIPGTEVGQLTRAARDGSIRILVCSAHGRQAADLAERADADAFLPKPFDIERLLSTVARLLAEVAPAAGQASPPAG